MAGLKDAKRQAARVVGFEAAADGSSAGVAAEGVWVEAAGPGADGAGASRSTQAAMIAVEIMRHEKRAPRRLIRT